MIDRGRHDRHGCAPWFSEGHTYLQHYLIVGYSSKGLELPYILSDLGQPILPVFSSEEAAQEFLSLSSQGKRWLIRGFSRGELVSVLFAFHAGMKGLSLDPPPGALAGDVMAPLVERDTYMSSLLETGRHHPGLEAQGGTACSSKTAPSTTTTRTAECRSPDLRSGVTQGEGLYSSSSVWAARDAVQILQCSP